MDFIKLYRELGIHGAACTKDQIAEIEAQTHALLPASYRAFMEVVGLGDFGPWAGSNYAYPSVLDAREALLDAWKDFGITSAPPVNHFVILSHQGYQFLALELDGTDDPPVLRYGESSAEPTVVAPRFSALVTAAVDGRSG